jgi:hypothetical protein
MQQQQQHQQQQQQQQSKMYTRGALQTLAGKNWHFEPDGVVKLSEKLLIANIIYSNAKPIDSVKLGVPAGKCKSSSRNRISWLISKWTRKPRVGLSHKAWAHDYYSIWQSFSDPAISSDSDSDWSPKFGLGLGLGLGLKKSWLSYTLTQNYQSIKYLRRFNYSRYLCMWFIKGIIGF